MAQVHQWGIIGTGRIAADFFQALKVVPDGKVVAVASAESLDRSQAFATQYGIPAAYGNVKDLLANKNVQIVYVASMHPFHKDHTIAALRAGKHVLCEKPLAMDSEEVQEMVKVAQETKRFFMEAMWTRYFPAFNKVLELIAEKKIGHVTAVYGHFGFLANKDVPRLGQKDLGAGALLDVGIYVLSLASAILGPEAPLKIEALGELSPEGIDEQVGVLLQYKKGLAVLHTAFNGDLPNEAHIVGSHGSIKLHKPFWCPVAITLSESDKEPQHFKFDLPEVPEAKFNFTNSAGLSYEIKYVHEAVGKGKLESEKLTQAESLTILQTMDKIRKLIGLHYKPSQ